MQSRRRLAQQSNAAVRCVVCSRDGGPCGCVAAGAAAAGYQCTPEADVQVAAVCTQLPAVGNATRSASSFARVARGMIFAAGDLVGASGAAGGVGDPSGAAGGEALRAFTFYGQCAPPSRYTCPHMPTHCRVAKIPRNSLQPCTAVPRCSARCAAGLNRVPALHRAFPRIWSPVRVISPCPDAHRCRRALLTGHATCDFVFDTAAVRVLRAMAGVVPAPAGAPGELAFEACSLGLGNVSIASGSCFTYDLVRATSW